MIALVGLGYYYDAARRQQRRIMAARRRQERTMAVGRRKIGRPQSSVRHIFDEIHFYLICWARIAKLAKSVAEGTNFRQVELVRQQYDDELKDRVDARNDFEHFEERLPGGTKVPKADPYDLENLHGDVFTFGGRKTNVGPQSVRILQAFVTEFQKAVLYDSLEAIAAAEPDRADAIVRQAASSVRIRRLTRKIESQFGPRP